MNTLSQVPDKMQQILTDTAKAAALNTGFVKRNRKLTGDQFAQILVFGWLENPDATWTQLAQTAGALGTPITRQAIEQRFTPAAAETLKTILEAAAVEVVSADPQVLPLLQQFNGVYLQDSTWITLPDVLHETWPGARRKNNPDKASVKLQLRFDVATGTFAHFQLTDGPTADSAAEKEMQPLPAESLRLTDLGYFSLETFEKLSEANVFWITRFKVGCSLFDEQGERFCLNKHLTSQNTDIIDLNCFIGATRHLPARLVAQKLSEQETQKRIRNIKQRAKRKNSTPSKKRLQLAGWNIYITNIGTDKLAPEQIGVISRIRWQVELMLSVLKVSAKLTHRVATNLIGSYVKCPRNLLRRSSAIGSC